MALPPDDLPPFLHLTDPMEVEHLPLHVALLTMEMAALRERLRVLEAAQIAEPCAPPRAALLCPTESYTTRPVVPCDERRGDGDSGRD